MELRLNYESVVEIALGDHRYVYVIYAVGRRC